MKNGADEIITILVLGLVAVLSMFLLEMEGKEIALTIGGGLIGYLKGSSPTPQGRDEL